MTIRRLAFLFAVLLAAGPARAWDPEIHVAIARAAIGISAGVEARVPLEFRDAIFKDAREADFVDKDCRYHISMAPPRDAAAEAEKVYQALTNPKIALRPYQRAQMIGRYLHFVADTIAPVELRNGAAPRLLNFFANQDFIIWREPRPLVGPLGNALRQRADEAAWANVNTATANPPLFRAVVNLVADALMLLPPRPELAAARDAGPVHLLINRIDNGLAGRVDAPSMQFAGLLDDSVFGGPGDLWIVWSWAPGSSRGGSKYKPNLLERQGVQLAELTAHKDAGGVVLRAVFLNNSRMCSDKVSVKSGSWTWTLPGKMPPNSIVAIEIQAPADVLDHRMGSRAVTDNCEGGKLYAAARKLDGRLVYGNGGGFPSFEVRLPESDIGNGAAINSRNYTDGR